MKANHTHIVIVLDQSGSMQSIVDDTIGGFNRLIEDQRAVPGTATVQLVRFNENVSPEQIVSIQDFQLLDRKRYQPSGWTALLDAVGTAITDAGDYLHKLPESERPSKVVVFVLSDGLENRSKKFSRTQVFDMIQHQREVYKWEVLFIGANMDAIAEAGSIGVADTHSINYAATSAGTKSLYSGASANLRSFREDRKTSMAWTNDQRAAQKAAQK